MGIQAKAFHIISLLILPILVIQTGLIFYGYCSATEVETRIQGINRDTPAAREQMPKSKFVLAPILYCPDRDTLVYVSEKDVLFGYYFHAVSKQYFDVLFIRMK